jgi:hypothetical protein
MEMNTVLVSLLMDIGRWKSGASPRPMDFYQSSLRRVREAGVEVTVFGNAEGADQFFSFSDLVSLLPAGVFDQLESIRCRTHGGGIQGESSWYAAITHAKMFLLERVFGQNPLVDAVVWLDSGLAGHGLVSPENLKNINPPTGFHVARAHAGSGWHVPGIEPHVTFPGRHVCGGLFGCRRSSFLPVILAYRRELVMWLERGVAPLEEDIFTLLEPTGVFEVHEGFGNLSTALKP